MVNKAGDLHRALTALSRLLASRVMKSSEILEFCCKNAWMFGELHHPWTKIIVCFPFSERSASRDGSIWSKVETSVPGCRAVAEVVLG